MSKRKLHFGREFLKVSKKPNVFNGFGLGVVWFRRALGKALCLPDARGLRPFGARGRRVEVRWEAMVGCVSGGGGIVLTGRGTYG